MGLFRGATGVPLMARKQRLDKRHKCEHSHRDLQEDMNSLSERTRMSKERGWSKPVETCSGLIVAIKGVLGPFGGGRYPKWPPRRQYGHENNKFATMALSDNHVVF